VAAQNLAEEASEGAALLRNEPVQARSTARLAGLLDAAAAVIDEIGYERLTTAMVAERAGASIGTVYRYFPDRIVVLQSLSARSLTDFSEQTRETLADPRHSTWWDAVEAALMGAVAAFRSTPGFRSLRFGDVLDIRPRPTNRTGNGSLAEIIASALRDRFNLGGDDLSFHLEIVVDAVDSLLARAFAFDPKGDDRIIRESLTITRAYLVSIYGEPKGA
jgi:AcrR family transcriptional regulator